VTDPAARPPRVGVSACFFHADPTRPIFKGKTLLYAEESMLDLFARSGALTYLLPRRSTSEAATTGSAGSAGSAGSPPVGPTVGDYVADLDGLVLEGGSDVCPRTYGEEPLRPEWEGDEARDRYEIDLIRAFLAAGKPVLGICRGVQILNVALGGTLHQDLATQLPDLPPDRHRDWERYDSVSHDVDVVAGSRLADLYDGATRLRVNSVHHQAIRDLADDLVVEARSSSDGIVEAVRGTGPGYVAGVQWHPEFIPVQPADRGELAPARPLVDDFLAAAIAVRPVGARS
jgi:putative glutamine amidotransferase